MALHPHVISSFYLRFLECNCNLEQYQNGVRTVASRCGSCLYKWSDRQTEEDFPILCHHFSHILLLVLCPFPPPRRGHTCLCLLWEPVYPVQMLLLFSPSHTHLSGPCQGHTASGLPLMLHGYVCQLFYLCSAYCSLLWHMDVKWDKYISALFWWSVILWCIYMWITCVSNLASLGLITRFECARRQTLYLQYFVCCNLGHSHQHLTVIL